MNLKMCIYIDAILKNYEIEKSDYYRKYVGDIIYNKYFISKENKTTNSGYNDIVDSIERDKVIVNQIRDIPDDKWDDIINKFRNDDVEFPARKDKY